MAKKLYYKIGEACKELDIQPYVLRYWETEFQALSPSKSKSGQRVYSSEDLELIGRIKELLYKEGYTIAGAKKKLESETTSRPQPVEVLAEPEDEKPSAPAASAPKRRKVAKKPSRAASKPAPKPAKASSEEASIARLRQGIEQALREAKDILAILDRA